MGRFEFKVKVGGMMINFYRNTNITNQSLPRNWNLTAEPMNVDVEGYVANTNGLQQYTVKIAQSYSVPQDLDLVGIVVDSWEVVGFVREIEYTNPTQCRIVINPSAYLTCLANGYTPDVAGVLERTQVSYLDENSLVNLIPEDFSNTDVKRYNNNVSNAMNLALNAFEWGGASPNSTMGYVLFISQRLYEFINEYGSWQNGVNPAVNAGNLVDIGTLGETERYNVSVKAYSMFGGETVAGYPCQFLTLDQMNTFIVNVLTTGYFFLRAMPEVSDDIMYHTTYVDGVATTTALFNQDDFIVEGARVEVFFDDSDFLGVVTLPLQLISQFWSNPAEAYTNDYDISGFFTTSNLISGLGSGVADTVKPKQCHYPYTYYTVESNLGGQIIVIPQEYFNRDTIFSHSGTSTIQFMAQGGNNPRIYMRFYNNWGDTTNERSSEWVLVREYSFLNLNSDLTIQNTQRVEQDNRHYQKSRDVSNSLSPFGVFRNILNNWTRNTVNATSGFNLGNIASGVVNPSESQEFINESLSSQNPQLFRQVNSILANGTGMVFAQQEAISVYTNGATNFEQVNLTNYLNRFGETINATVNTIQSPVSPMAGITTVIDGKVYYKFANAEITGVPERFKNEIAELFVGGVFLES